MAEIKVLSSAGAHIFEAIGYTPCALCLDQREAHWAALAIAVLGLGISLGLKAKLLAIAAVGTLTMIYFFSTGLAFYHTGVEFGFWPGPATCSGIKTIPSIEELSQRINANNPVIACNRAAWSFLGISMAGYNMLASAGLTAIGALTTYIAIYKHRKP